MKARNLLLPIILVIVGMPNCSVLAQTLKGKVVFTDEKGIKQPLVGANLRLLGTKLGTVTDTNGVFHFSQSDGAKQIAISFTGFKTDTVTIPSAGNLTVELKTADISTSEVSVTEQAITSMQMPNEVGNTTLMREGELQKAACCNLSESFETSASVDVNYADAISGAKQIQMLGLPGIYTQLQTENIPGTRGLASNFGLSYIPGPWVESIQVTKGAGSVLNGFESMTGQINIELKKPETAEKLYFNTYINQMGRTETNLNLATKTGKRLSTALLLHTDYWKNRFDRNADGFMDIPQTQSFSVLNRWKYEGERLKAQWGFKYLNDQRDGGELNTSAMELMDGNPAWRFGTGTNRYEVFSKLGLVFPKQPYKSIGLILSGTGHYNNGYFGLQNYKAQQQSAYLNFIYQGIIGSTLHKFRTGFSYQADDFNEQLNQNTYLRTELVPGIYYEHTWEPSPKTMLVAGLRTDYNNLYGAFVTPRLHIKHNFGENTTLRLSAGRGQRTANIIAENAAILSGSRKLVIDGNPNLIGFGLRPEVSWNYGLSLSQDYEMFEMPGTFILDAYRTQFQNQVVTDFENAREIRFYNLNNASFSNSLQAEASLKPIRRFNIRLAWRWVNAKTEYQSGTKMRPLLASNRAFANLAYDTRNGWKFDYTFSWTGPKRLPSTKSNPAGMQWGTQTPGFVTMQAQITKVFKFGLEVYCGLENLTDFRQADLIISASNPWSGYYDGSLVWGPIVGRMTYAGIRYKIKQAS